MKTSNCAKQKYKILFHLYTQLSKVCRNMINRLTWRGSILRQCFREIWCRPIRKWLRGRRFAQSSIQHVRNIHMGLLGSYEKAISNKYITLLKIIDSKMTWQTSKQCGHDLFQKFSTIQKYVNFIVYFLFTYKV